MKKMIKWFIVKMVSFKLKYKHMKKFENTATGEIIKARTFKKACKYFKKDAKKGGYKYDFSNIVLRGWYY